MPGLGPDKGFGEIAYALNWVRAIRGNVAEAELLVEMLRLSHGGQGVEDDLGVADGNSLSENGRNEGAAEAKAPTGGTNEEPLHLCARPAGLVKCDAADGRTCVGSEQEAASGRSVGTGEVADFGLEALKAEIDAKKGVVLEYERPNRSDLFRSGGLRNVEHGCP